MHALGTMHHKLQTELRPTRPSGLPPQSGPSRMFVDGRILGQANVEQAGEATSRETCARRRHHVIDHARGRLWSYDGSSIRLRAERANHVWSNDFMRDRTHHVRVFPMLNISDPSTRESLAVRIRCRRNSTCVIDVPTDRFIAVGSLRAAVPIGTAPALPMPPSTPIVSGVRTSCRPLRRVRAGR